jgi:DNA-binding MarR family transcriptional regulator
MSSSPPIHSSRSATELAETLGARLRLPYRRLQKELYAEMERQFPDIRRAHSVVFRHLAPKGSRLTDLAEQADMTKQSMAYLVGHLTELGYLKTGKHPEDGRAVLVQLTAKGRKFLGAALATSAELEQRVAARMGQKQMTELRELLARLDACMVDEEEAGRGAV